MDDTAHITEEMYKKNLELNERNKMLDLLRKIDRIILGSLTKVDQIADQVTREIIKNTQIKSVFIYLMDKKNSVLYPLSIAFAKSQVNLSDDIYKVYYSEKIPLSEEKSPLIQALKTRKIIQDKAMSDIFMQVNKEIVQETQKEMEIKEFLSHPFYVRDETAGVIVFGLGDREITFSYWSDFITRLPEVISIAINNAILYQKIQENNEELKQLDHLKDEFVSVASHELRSPMTAIKNYLWLAIDKTKNEKGELPNYLNIAYSSTERLLSLVEDMLTVSRIEGKRLVLKTESVNLSEMAKQVYDELAINAEKNKVKVNLKLGSDNFKVTGDKEKLREVLQNLFSNAVKFTPENGHIDINLSEKGSQIVAEIFNSDSYISKENAAKLFEKFRQLDMSQTKTPEAKGTGLGLYISKQIIELHKGRIEVVSEENEGTSFIIYLPKEK